MKFGFPQLKITCLICISVLASNVYSQSIIPWTEQNGTLGLGYPVPIPVDTLEPFDGFRTYAGLFAKHQMMALENDYITGHIVGQTIYNRDIWAYLLSDDDDTTRYGVKEGAMMANGGIHAREWQSPETLTQIISDFHDHSDDESFYQYLLENAAIITIPSNNIDGFLQTQRYPTQNWYASNTGPRDGRMRRKNLLNTDEDLDTQNDYLNGVDLNRNNDPYWASSNGSSNNPTSLVFHGSASQSEPETMARLAAADLVDADQLRIYTDVHSFSQVHFANKSFNNNLNILQTRVLADFRPSSSILAVSSDASPSPPIRSITRSAGVSVSRSRNVWRTIRLPLSGCMGSQFFSCLLQLTIISKLPSSLSSISEASR